MREPENLKELIEYFEWNYERMEDDHDVICTFTDGDGFHDLLNDLKRKSAMCEADSNAVLAEVLKIIDKKYLKEDGIKNIDFNKIDSVVRECIKIEINKCLNETKKEILSISANIDGI